MCPFNIWMTSQTGTSSPIDSHSGHWLGCPPFEGLNAMKARGFEIVAVFTFKTLSAWEARRIQNSLLVMMMMSLSRWPWDVGGPPYFCAAPNIKCLPELILYTVYVFICETHWMELILVGRYITDEGCRWGVHRELHCQTSWLFKLQDGPDACWKELSVEIMESCWRVWTLWTSNNIPKLKLRW